MNLYLQKADDRGMTRITDALRRHALPTVSFTDLKKADIAILLINGRIEHTFNLVKNLRGMPFVIIQIAFRSTRNPNPLEWISLWQKACLVWSYYDLPGDFEFYRSPLGVDDVFTYTEARKKYLICTIGDYMTEGVRECILAAGDRKVAHVCPYPYTGRPNEDGFSNIPDSDLRDVYCESEYVSGLRRIEGFELPAAEGLVCGARPIMYDQPHYRHWYGDLVEYIPEAPRTDVIESLKTLFAEPVRKVTPAERKEARLRFDWATIIGGFYDRLL